MLIDLSKDWPYVLRVADERLAHNITAHHISDYGNEIEIMGAAGELAARRYFGVDEQLHTHFDGGIDFVYCGISIDVKATKLVDHLDHLHLQWPRKKPLNDVDVILLTAVDMEEKKVMMVGWATPKEVQAAQVNLFRRDPCYEIQVPQLRRVKELYERKNFKKNSTNYWLQTVPRKRRGPTV